MSRQVGHSQRLCALALAGAVAGLTATPGLAAPPTAEARAEAATLLAEGYALFKAGRFVDAASTFERANGLVPDPLNLRNIGRAYEKAERPGLALKWLDEHLASKDSEERLSRTRSDRARIASAYLGLLSVECAPAETQVVVERLGEGVVAVPALGEPQACPVRMELEPGRYQIKASAEGFTAEERLVAVRSADVSTESLTLLSLQATAAAEGGASGWAVATLATGGALLATGGVMHALNVSKADELKGDADNQGLRDSVDATAYGAIGGYSLGGALLISGLIWYLAGGGSPAAAPAAGAGPAGVWVQW